MAPPFNTSRGLSHENEIYSRNHAGCDNRTAGRLSGQRERHEHRGNPENVIFFLGDGMGITTLTAARIYSVGEDGNLTIDILPETAFVKTYSNDAQVTRQRPSMAAYMTGVKTNNEVISMTPDTVATPPSADANGNLGINNCQNGNGKTVPTLLELAKAKGWKVGSITTTELTHATPAATFSHICNRNAQYAIAAQLAPGGSGFNSALYDGVDVLMGGELNHFTPYVSSNERQRPRRWPGLDRRTGCTRLCRCQNKG